MEELKDMKPASAPEEGSAGAVDHGTLEDDAPQGETGAKQSPNSGARKRKAQELDSDSQRDAMTSTNRFALLQEDVAAPSSAAEGSHVSSSTEHDPSPEHDPSNGSAKKRRLTKSERKARQRAQAERELQTDKAGTGNDGSPKSAKNMPRLVFAGPHRVQSMLRLGDLQNLVLYCIADDVAPQWIGVHKHAQIRKAVVLMVPGLEKGMFTGEMNLEADNGQESIPAEEGVAGSPEGVNNQPGAKISRVKSPLDEDGFQRVGRNPDDYLPMSLKDRVLPHVIQPLALMFDHVWPVKCPGDEKYSKLHSPIHGMLLCPVSKSQKHQAGPSPATPAKDWVNQPTPITAFLASHEDMLEGGYPLHPTCVPALERDALQERRRQNEQSYADGWRDTDVSELEAGNVPEGDGLTAGRTVWTVDCEMCLVHTAYVLTRISIVDWDGNVVMDEFVKPDDPITDYLTAYSGITVDMLRYVTTSLEDIQKKLLKLISPQTILVGHSLDSDLRALKLTHPFVVDTSLLYPHPRGPPLRSSLKWLTQKYLGRSIQQGHGSSGHDSVEDARATLALVKLKCERGPAWGSFAAQQESVLKRISRSKGRLEPGDDRGLGRRSGAIVNSGNPERVFPGISPYYIGAEDDAGIVAAAKRAINGDIDGAYIPGGGVDFTWARLSDLEMLRGWSRPSNRTVSDSNSSDDLANPSTDPSPASLAAQVSTTVSQIQEIYNTLPPCTLFIVYSGSGDTRELFRLQNMQREFRREYAVKKWDELSVQWTDTEEQAMKRACAAARRGVGLMTVKQ